MGDFEKDSESGHTGKTDSDRTLIITILMTLIAFLAPIATSGYNYGYSYNLTITALIWSIHMDGYIFSFQFLDFYSLAMIPFSIFRFVFVYQIARYYQGKTTKTRTAIAAGLSEAPLLALYALLIITSAFYGGLGLNFPLPIMTVVGLLLIWKLPAPEVTVPWEGADEPKSWWEKSLEDKTDSTADNQPW